MSLQADILEAQSLRDASYNYIDELSVEEVEERSYSLIQRFIRRALNITIDGWEDLIIFGQRSDPDIVRQYQGQCLELPEEVRRLIIRKCLANFESFSQLFPYISE